MQAQRLSPWSEPNTAQASIPPDHIWIQLDHPDQAMSAWSLLQTLACKAKASPPSPAQDQV